MKQIEVKQSVIFSKKLCPYGWTKCGSEDRSWNEYQGIRNVYRFDNRFGQKYLVYADFHKHDVVIVKFFLRNMKSNANKFKYRTHTGDAFRILATVIAISRDLYLAHPNCSFAFIGENDQHEDRESTKRFRVYQKYAKAFFSPDNFQHLMSKSISGYFLANKKSYIYKNLDDAVQMFTELFNIASESDNIRFESL